MPDARLWPGSDAKTRQVVLAVAVPLGAAVIGLLIGVTSLAILGPAMTVLAFIVVAAELILHRLAPLSRPPQPPSCG